jgi:hypothetical protein
MNHKAYKAQKDFQGAKTTNYELRTKDYGLRTPLVRGVGQMAEQVLAKFADDELFCAESLVIENKQGHLVPFIWNPAQSKLDAAIRKQQADGLPVRLLILKSRRSGFSTGVAGKLFKQTAFYDGQKALVVAHEKEPATNIFTMYARFHTHYKPFAGVVALPELKSDTRQGLEYKNGSSIQIATANNLEGSRSFNFRRVHLSEFAFYRNARTLMTALMQTVPDDPDTLVIIESTANGIGGEFYDMWQEATDSDKKSDWLALFFGCYEDPDAWRELDTSADVFQETLTDEEWQLVERYNLHLEQINWRRWTIRNKCNNDPRIFAQEYPANPQEAFLVSGRPRFDHNDINLHVATNGATGELECLQSGEQSRLVFTVRERGALQIWKRPEKKHSYVIGADTALGLDVSAGTGTADPDYSVAQIFDRDTGEQVAIFRARITESAFGKYLAMLGQWYNWAYLVPEVQKGYGRSTLDTLLACKYPQHRIYNRRNEAVPSKPRYEDLGWETNTVTRPLLLNAVDNALLENSISIYDATTIQELRTFVTNKDGKAEAQRGCHDDTVIALALAIIGIQRAPRETVERKKRHYDREAEDQHWGESQRERVRRKMGL